MGRSVGIIRRARVWVGAAALALGGSAALLAGGLAGAEPTPAVAGAAIPAAATAAPVTPAPAGAAPAAGALPPAAARAVDFDKDVRPILANGCASCHGGGKSKGDFRIDTRQTFIKGGKEGAAAVEGDSARSRVIRLVTGVGVDEDSVMPQKGRRLTAEEVGVLRAWIDQGMGWPDGFTFAAGKTAPLAPRKVELPAHAAGTNPIDALLAPYFAKHGVSAGVVVDDRTFARRVWLDVVGLLPPPEQLEAFANDPAPDKRAKLVRRLLDDHKAYAEHWLSFWNDLLRNDYKGTGYIDGGRKQITPWLYAALASNMPFDRFVRELVTGANGSEGFVKGIVWRGVVNAAQTPQMQAAQNISQVFMGANLKCASCHDSFVSAWKLEDAYGLAGIYADKPLEMERCNTPLGKVAGMKFLYPELGSIDSSLPREKRLEQLANLITSPKNGRLARTVVNRLWKQFLGRGLVEPVDEMDHEPWSADLLDWLAVDLAEANGWDLKKTMARILTSRAYQMPVAAVAEGGEKGPYVFRGPAVRRLTAEQFVDALARVTGAPTGKALFDPGAPTPAPAATKKGQYGGAKWVWTTAGAEKSARPGKAYFRKTLDLHDHLVGGEMVVTADNAFSLFVNGKRVIGGEDWHRPVVVVDVQKYFRGGKNVVAIEAVNTTDSPNPAGLFASGSVVHRHVGERKVASLSTDKTWLASDTAPEGWTSVGFDDSQWKPAAELGDVRMAPWKLDQKLAGGGAVAARPAKGGGGEARAALCAGDPLMTALGRTNREQVTTERQSVATTLQMLELSNGGTLAEMLKKGAAKLAAEKAAPEGVVEQVYQRALGRKPTAGERPAAVELVGAPATAEGVEDLLWIVAMLPEFQLVR